VVSKLKLSENVSEDLDDLSRRLGLRRNIICRVAAGRSITEGNLEAKLTLDDFSDSKGFEFNRYTLTGEYDQYFKALIIQLEGRPINDNDYFSLYLRKHIERGINIMSKEFKRVRSKTSYLSKLADGERVIKVVDLR